MLRRHHVKLRLFPAFDRVDMRVAQLVRCALLRQGICDRPGRGRALALQATLVPALHDERPAAARVAGVHVTEHSDGGLTGDGGDLILSTATAEALVEQLLA